jgi:hypothetical protein
MKRSNSPPYQKKSSSDSGKAPVMEPTDAKFNDDTMRAVNGVLSKTPDDIKTRIFNELKCAVTMNECSYLREVLTLSREKKIKWEESKTDWGGKFTRLISIAVKNNNYAAIAALADEDSIAFLPSSGSKIKIGRFSFGQSNIGKSVRGVCIDAIREILFYGDDLNKTHNGMPLTFDQVEVLLSTSDHWRKDSLDIHGYEICILSLLEENETYEHIRDGQEFRFIPQNLIADTFLKNMSEFINAGHINNLIPERSGTAIENFSAWLLSALLNNAENTIKTCKTNFPDEVWNDTYLEMNSSEDELIRKYQEECGLDYYLNEKKTFPNVAFINRHIDKIKRILKRKNCSEIAKKSIENLVNCYIEHNINHYDRSVKNERDDGCYETILIDRLKRLAKVTISIMESKSSVFDMIATCLRQKQIDNTVKSKALHHLIEVLASAFKYPNRNVQTKVIDIIKKLTSNKTLNDHYDLLYADFYQRVTKENLTNPNPITLYFKLKKFSESTQAISLTDKERGPILLIYEHLKGGPLLWSCYPKLNKTVAHILMLSDENNLELNLQRTFGDTQEIDIETLCYIKKCASRILEQIKPPIWENTNLLLNQSSCLEDEKNTLTNNNLVSSLHHNK